MRRHQFLSSQDNHSRARKETTLQTDTNVTNIQRHLKSLGSVRVVSLEHKAVISSTGIFIAIANNTLYGSKL